MIQAPKSRPRGIVDPTRPTPARIVSATKAGSVLTVTFDQAVRLKGVPQYTVNVVGADPLSAELTNINTLELTFDAAITAATTLTIEFEEQGIRSSTGGFVADTMFPVT